MEQSAHNLSQSSPKPDGGIGTIDTPRTSNLKFLRAKRLSYFCGKSGQSHSSSTEKTPCVGSQKNQQSTMIHTPRRCSSAPTPRQEKSVSSACHVQKRGNVRENICSPGEERYSQATESKTQESATDNILQGSPGKESPTDSPSHPLVQPSENKHKAKEPTNSKNNTEKPLAKISVQKSLQQASENSSAQEAAAGHSLQPAPFESTKAELINHSLQPLQEEAECAFIYAHHILQQAPKEAIIKEYHYDNDTQSRPEKAKTDVFGYQHQKSEDAEMHVASTHRSSVRSSFVSDLDQNLLEDESVPETEKLQHVMTWAKKFLNKRNSGSNLPSVEDDDVQSNNTVDKAFKLNSAADDSLAQYDMHVESHDNVFQNQPYINEQIPSESTSVKFWVSTSPRNKFKTKSFFKDISHEPDPLLSKIPMFPNSHRDHEDYRDNFTKPLQTMCQQRNRFSKDPFRINSHRYLSQTTVDSDSCSEEEDIYKNGLKANQWDHSLQLSSVSKSDPDIKDNLTDKEGSTSSTEASPDTERLKALLENLEIMHSGSVKTTNFMKIDDGVKTDRTFLVKKFEETDENIEKKILNWSPPRLHKVSSNTMYEFSTSNDYAECPVCRFSNTTKTSWCAECGTVLNSVKGQRLRNDPENEKDVLDDFFSVKKDVTDLDKIPMSKKHGKEDGRSVCWEDNSDVLSDCEGSIFEKYLLYVQQLDEIKEKEKQSHYFKGDVIGNLSSEDDSSEDYTKPQKNSGIVNTSVTNRHTTNDLDDTVIQFLQNSNCLVKSDLYHSDQQSRMENHVIGSTEKKNETEVSNCRGPLDRKLQKATNISSKVTGPQRYWEKSSIAWSSYTHGELKPRSHGIIQRPASAELRRKCNEYKEYKATNLDTSKKMARQIKRPKSSITKATDYKGVATAYMKAANSWAVTEHLCQSDFDVSSNNRQWVSECDCMWLCLPDELWIYIFRHLSQQDLSKVAQVCQRLRYIANDDILWKVIKITNRHSLDDICLANIGLHHPESLSVYRCHDDTQSITEEGLRQLFENCKDSLTELNVKNCSGHIFGGDMVLCNSSNYCTRLTSVDISWTAATDKGIIALVEASACLQSLSMNGCKITDHAITALLKKHYKSLNKIEVFGCHALSAKSLISVATDCTNLENLNIGRIPKATDLCLSKIATNLHKMTTLNLTGLNMVRDRAVHLIVKQCSKLENLSLSSCTQVTDVSLVEISTYLRTIKYLDVSGCKKVSDIGVQALARSCQQLRYLDLSSTATGKRGVCLLACYSHTTLECVKLSFCKEVTADAIEKLCKNCKRLKMLHLFGCRVSPDLDFIQKFSKSCQIFLSVPTAKIIGE